MDRFAQWLRRQGERQSPTAFVVIGVVGSFVVPELLLMNVVPTTPTSLVAAIGATVASWAPLATRRYRTRHELRVSPKGFVGSVAHWTKAEDRLPTLEEAAVDLEQIEALAGKVSLDPAPTKALVQAANERMRRVFELSVSAPARYGLTLAQAESQIGEDVRWIAEARRLLERTLEAATTPRWDDSLEDLRAFVAARDEVFAELRA